MRTRNLPASAMPSLHFSNRRRSIRPNVYWTNWFSNMPKGTLPTELKVVAWQTQDELAGGAVHNNHHRSNDQAHKNIHRWLEKNSHGKSGNVTSNPKGAWPKVRRTTGRRQTISLTFGSRGTVSVSSALISELWTELHIKVLVPKSSARQRRKSHGRSNASGKAKSKGSETQRAAGKPAQQGDRFCVTERHYGISLRLKLAHRSAG